jgi:ribosomal protein S18 acetylase RimI-like enzyme
MTIHLLPDVPPGWEDPILNRATAQRLLAQPGHILYETRHPDRPSAHLLARLIPHAPADVLTLYTPPTHRRLGMARALLEHFLTEARDAKCPTVTLEVRASNAAAIGLYKRMGFTQAATRPRYYQTPVEDALVLTKTLSEDANG